MPIAHKNIMPVRDQKTKYRIVFVKMGEKTELYKVQKYQKWLFRWFDVKDWHDRLPFKVPLYFQTKEDAERFIDSNEITEVIVSYKTVYRTRIV